MKIIKIEKSNIIRQQIRIRLFNRYAIYLDVPIRIKYLANNLGGKNLKVKKWSIEQKKKMSEYMKNDWKRRKANQLNSQTGGVYE